MLYVDTGVVTKWYLPETDSFSALALRDRFSPPAVLTGLHRLELNNAWQLKIFRGELSTDTVALAWAHFVEDVQAGLWHVLARLIHHPLYCDAAKPRIYDVSLGRASSPYS